VSPLAARVEAALKRPPLCEVSAAARAELDELVAVADSLEDLPGKWQAAVLRAEGGDGGGSSGCCAGRSNWSI
jgi:hypothetical protein